MASRRSVPQGSLENPSTGAARPESAPEQAGCGTAGACAFRVTVYYREPSYELAAGYKSAPYAWTYEIDAADAAAAETEALRRFDEMARSSSVGWVRRIVRVDTRPSALDGAWTSPRTPPPALEPDS